MSGIGRVAGRWLAGKMELHSSFKHEGHASKLSARHPTRIIRVAVVEDEADARHLFRAMLNRSAGLGCVGACISGEQALHELPAQLPDVVLMDIHLPGMDGIACMRALRKLLPKLKTVMVTSDRDDELLFESLGAGADSYVTKPCGRAELAKVIADTMAGKRAIATDMAGYLIKAAVHPPKRRLPPHPLLSERENEAMRWLAEGLGNSEIAERMGVSVFTVNAHLQNSYGKLGVNNRVEALRAVERG